MECSRYFFILFLIFSIISKTEEYKLLHEPSEVKEDFTKFEITDASTDAQGMLQHKELRDGVHELTASNKITSSSKTKFSQKIKALKSSERSKVKTFQPPTDMSERKLKHTLLLTKRSSNSPTSTERKARREAKDLELFPRGGLRPPDRRITSGKDKIILPLNCRTKSEPKCHMFCIKTVCHELCMQQNIRICSKLVG